MADIQWVTIGKHGYDEVHIRVDQIASWSDNYYNGWQHYLDVTLTTGKSHHAEVDKDQWDKFKEAIGG